MEQCQRVGRELVREFDNGFLPAENAIRGTSKLGNKGKGKGNSAIRDTLRPRSPSQKPVSEKNASGAEEEASKPPASAEGTPADGGVVAPAEQTPGTEAGAAEGTAPAEQSPGQEEGDEEKKKAEEKPPSPFALTEEEKQHPYATIVDETLIEAWRDFKTSWASADADWQKTTAGLAGRFRRADQILKQHHIEYERERVRLNNEAKQAGVRVLAVEALELALVAELEIAKAGGLLNVKAGQGLVGGVVFDRRDEGGQHQHPRLGRRNNPIPLNRRDRDNRRDKTQVPEVIDLADPPNATVARTQQWPKGPVAKSINADGTGGEDNGGPDLDTLERRIWSYVLRVQDIQKDAEVTASQDKNSVANVHKAWARLRNCLQTILTWQMRAVDTNNVEVLEAHARISYRIQQYRKEQGINTDAELFEKEGLKVGYGEEVVWEMWAKVRMEGP